MTRTIRTFCLLTLLASAMPTVAQDAPGDARRARSLVRQLGDPAFEVRERATLQLAELEMRAYDALQAGLNDEDAEVRARCRRILTVALEADHRRRLKAFASDRDGRLEINIPGWRRFAQIVGDGLPQRELFVQMSVAESTLMRCEPASTEKKSEPPTASETLLANTRSTTFNARCSLNFESLRGGAAKLSAAGVAALLFASMDARVEASDRNLYYLQQLAYQQVVRHAMTNDGVRSELFQKLLGGWIAQTAQRADAFQSVQLAMYYGLPEGIKPSLAIVGRPVDSAQTFVFGVLGVARFGAVQDAKALAPLLKSEATYLVRTANAANEVHVRDVALAATIHLHGEDPKKWGFAQAQKNDRTVYDPNSLVFPTSQDREAAHKRWQARAEPK